MEPAPGAAHHDGMEPIVSDTAVHPMPIGHRTAMQTAWDGWARQTFPADPATATRAADAAGSAVDLGGSTTVGVVAAFVAAGVSPPPSSLASLDTERWRLRELLDELSTVPPVSPGGARTDLGADLRRRLLIADQIAGTAVAAGSVPPTWANTGGPRTPGVTGYVAGDPHTGASDQGVRILGATGVFLLLTATMLFEVFGVPARDRVLRFLVVAGLEAALIIAGATSGKSDRFRRVSGVYVAAAALVLPVVLAAGLAAAGSGSGLRPAVAVAICALCCMAAYGWLARELRSGAYASLALVATGIAWLAGSDAIGVGKYAGLTAPTAALLACIYLAVDALAARTGWAMEAGGRWSGMADALAGPAPWFAGLAGAVATASALLVVDRSEVPGWSGPLALCMVAAALACTVRVSARSSNLLPAVIAGSAAVLAASPWLAWGPAGLAFVLDSLAIGAVWVTIRLTATSVPMEGAGVSVVGGGLRALAAVEATAVLLVVSRPEWWVPVALVVAAGVPCWIGRLTGDANWSWASVPMAVAAWFTAARMVSSVFGSNSHQPLGLWMAARLLAPLPVALVVLGVLLRGRWSAWSRGLQAVASGLGVVVVWLTLAGGVPVAAGVELLIIWLAVIAVSSVERWTAPLPFGVATGLAGAALVAMGDGWGAELAVTAMLGVVLVEYGLGTGIPERRTSSSERSPGIVHRSAALAGSAVGVVVALGLLTTGRGHGAPLAAVLAVVVSAGLLGIEGRQAGARWWSTWAAVGIASLIGLPLAVASGTHNPQWYVLAPGLTLLMVGLRLPGGDRDPRAVRHGRWLTGAGAGLLLVTTAGMVLGQGGGNGGWLALLVTEGAVLVIGGCCLQRRVPVIAGAVGVAAGGLAALALVPSTLALSLVIGAASLAVLATATVLMAGGRRIVQGHVGTREATWDRWR